MYLLLYSKMIINNDDGDDDVVDHAAVPARADVRARRADSSHE